MRRSSFAMLGACLLLSSTIGCGRLEKLYEESKETKEPKDTKVGSTSISMATVRRADGIDNRDAERMIAVARCGRQTACAKIRGREPRAGQERCARDIAQKVHAELGAPSCGTSIAREALDECLGELGAEDCDGSFDGLTRIAVCQSKVLCRR